MIPILKEPYIGWFASGPHLHKKQKRYYVTLTKNSRRINIVYARFIMEIHLGITLSSDIDVHHKDGNTLNDSLSNLEIKPEEKHIGDHNKTRTIYIELECFYCKKKFKRKLWLRSKGLHDFCSRKCLGKYTKS